MEQSIRRMAEMPVKRLLFVTGLPMILSMVLQALYNIVDSAFVSNMVENGEAALNALTLAFPIQMLIVALAIGTGVGTNALLSRCLGSGERERASKVAGNSVFLGAVISLLAILFGLFGAGPYIGSQTTNPQIYEMGVCYLQICCTVPVGIVFFSVFEKLLQASGLALYSTIAQITGAVLNIVLDPILIGGLLGAPKLGVAGAAWATVIGQVASCLLALLFHLRRNRSVLIRGRDLVPAGSILAGIYKIGLPAILAQALMSVMTYGLNLILLRVSESMVTAYGLYYKIQQFLLFAAFGMRDAITPVIGFSYGAGDRSRVAAGKKYGLRYTVGIMAAGLVLLELLAVPLAALFGLSGETETLCVSAIRIGALSMVFAGVNIAFQGVFQGLDRGRETLTIALLRQLVLVLPAAYVLSLLARENAAPSWVVWLSFLFSEGGSALAAFLLMKRAERNRGTSAE